MKQKLNKFIPVIKIMAGEIAYLKIDVKVISIIIGMIENEINFYKRDLLFLLFIRSVIIEIIQLNTNISNYRIVKR